jgi:hypothetical protein
VEITGASEASGATTTNENSVAVCASAPRTTGDGLRLPDPCNLPYGLYLLTFDVDMSQHSACLCVL